VAGEAAWLVPEVPQAALALAASSSSKNITEEELPVSVSTVIQKQIVDQATSVVVTEIVQDPVTNLYVREIRVMDSSTPPIVQFTLRMVAATRSALELTAPTQQF
jgi:regulator of protease activity HflC (stomatin/prohibitin superfamily)